MSEPPRPPGLEVGLCSRCDFARVKRSARGSVFWRCALADSDPRFSRYPSLPVRACTGFRPGTPAPQG
jgi:hypothetical protein